MTKQRFKTSDNEDFDLDEFLNEQAHSSTSEKQRPQETEQTPSPLVKNLSLFGVTFLLAFMWTFDWSPKKALLFFMNDDAAYLSTSLVEPNDEAPSISTFEALETSPSNIDFEFSDDRTATDFTTTEPSISFTDYLTELNDLGYLSMFGSSSLEELYTSNVPVSYVQELTEIGVLENFESSSISNLYSNNVPVSFIEELSNRGILENMSSTSVINAYKIDGQ